MTSLTHASYDITPFKTIMEKGQDQSPGKTFLMTKKKDEKKESAKIQMQKHSG